MKELDFLGHRITDTGISPVEAKVAALRSFRRPENANEVRSFLGLANYLNRFIPNLATIDEPLRELTRKGTIFHWLEQHEAAFVQLKQIMSSPMTLGFFKVGDRTLVMADASPIGLGALLIQVNNQGEHRIICFASKSLTDTEKRYCHTEKEALSLVWSVEKFYIYLYGIEFELLTDCKALIYLFTPRSRPCLRIERWVLRLQGFNYRVTHIPGDQNRADVLSRLTTLKPTPFDTREEIMVQEIVSFAVNSVAVHWEEFVRASQTDSQIKSVLELLRAGKQDDLPVEFRVFASEMCGIEDVLMRGDRIVVPEELRTRVLEIAHEGHLGICMMKTALRSCVWWPRMEKEVEQFVKKCRGCILVSVPDAPEPMKRRQMPAGPWEEIAIDFMGPLPEGQWLFVVVDYYSRFVEVVEMHSTTAKDTIRELSTIFGRFGVPRSIRADNGPQLSKDCQEWKDFCEEYDIQLINTTPYWPQANGEVERQNRTILKRLRIAQELGNDWRLELRKFLLAYHSTIHSVTGRSPSELMFGRRIRNKLPAVPSIAKDDEETRDRDKVMKEKGKEYADKQRKARDCAIKIGDYVYVKRMRKQHKLNSEYSPEKFQVTHREGTEVTVTSTVSGNVLKRNVAHLKLAEDHQESKNSDIEEGVPIAKDVGSNRDTDSSSLRGDETRDKVLGTEKTNSDSSTKRRRVEPKRYEDYIPY